MKPNRCAPDYIACREIETTTTKVHDSQIDLLVEGEVVLRDRGYFGMRAKGDDFTMGAELMMSLLERLIKSVAG